jgi:hypothetical protein
MSYHYFEFDLYLERHYKDVIRAVGKYEIKRTIPHTKEMDIRQAVWRLQDEAIRQKFDVIIIKNIYYVKGTKKIGKINYNVPSIKNRDLEGKISISESDHYIFNHDGTTCIDPRLLKEIWRGV